MTGCALQLVHHWLLLWRKHSVFRQVIGTIRVKHIASQTIPGRRRRQRWRWAFMKVNGANVCGQKMGPTPSMASWEIYLVHTSRLDSASLWEELQDVDANRSHNNNNSTNVYNNNNNDSIDSPSAGSLRISSRTQTATILSDKSNSSGGHRLRRSPWLIQLEKVPHRGFWAEERSTRFFDRKSQNFQSSS